MGRKNHVQILYMERHFLGRGHVPAYGNVSTAGECICPAHTGDDCIRHQLAMRPLAKILWTLVYLTLGDVQFFGPGCTLYTLTVV